MKKSRIVSRRRDLEWAAPCFLRVSATLPTMRSAFICICTGGVEDTILVDKVRCVDRGIKSQEVKCVIEVVHFDSEEQSVS